MFGCVTPYLRYRRRIRPSQPASNNLSADCSHGANSDDVQQQVCNQRKSHGDVEGNERGVLAGASDGMECADVARGMGEADWARGNGTVKEVRMPSDWEGRCVRLLVRNDVLNLRRGKVRYLKDRKPREALRAALTG